MTERLPAIIAPPCSDREYWILRLQQWLRGQWKLTSTNYSSDMEDFARWAGKGTVEETYAALFLGDPETVALRVRATALDYLDDLKTRDVWDSTVAKARGDDPVRKGLAPATIGRRMGALRAVVRIAAEARFCPRGIELPKGPKVRTLRDTRGISRTSFLQLLDTVDHTLATTKPGSQQHDLAIRDGAVLRLLHDIGLRRVEVHGILIQNIVNDDRGMSVWIRRKGDEETELRLWPIAKGPAQAIETWLHTRGDPTRGPVFTTRKGKPMTLGAFNKVVSKWGIRGEIGHVHPHKLRHTAISTLARKTKGNITGMQSFAAHRDPKHTAIYVDNEGEEIRALQELLGEGDEDES